MKKVVATVRLSILYLLSIFLVATYPFAVMAETTPVVSSSPTTSQAVAPTTNSPATSNLSAVTTTPNSTVSTVPPSVTGAAIPTPTLAPKPTYTYNSGTSHWDSNKWQYNPATGAYTPVIPPAPIIIQPVAPATVSNSSTGPITNNPTAPLPTTQTVASSTSNTLSTLANALDSNAISGNATVAKNTAAGSAMTGNATVATTILNNVNSSLTNSNNQKAANFVSNITGNVNGDIVLQPMLLKAMLESGATNPNSSAMTVNNTSKLTNNINLAAASGNANVTGNTTAGSATTGSANTVANVMNIINSMVAANQSFVGTINIYGSLNGDILIAPSFIPQLLASNSGGTGSSSTTSVSTPSIVNVKDTQSIVNNVALAAASGSAAVSNNTNAGTAKTGNANTNVVIFNLSGHQIVANNSLLVFVNVLGKWVGVIVDAPTGATAAAIGNGVTTNNTVTPDLIVNATNNSQITNNIYLNSTSGNALVAGNTKAGNATSGNATASANIANISGSQFGLSGWFGILFINVFGSWYGSFGIDTAAGNPTASADSTQPVKVIDFIPRTASFQPLTLHNKVTIINSSSDGAKPSVVELNPQGGNVMGASTSNNTTPQGSALPRVDFRLPILVGAIFLIGISGLVLRRILFS